MKKNSISIAMATYNGELYLQEQLDSFKLQSILPDELIVCDDGSTDSTINILEEFAKKAGFVVRIESNPKQLGSTGNFEKAIRLCTGSIIVLSDQDDIWNHDKLQWMLTAFNENPAAGYVFSNAERINEAGESLDFTLWETIRFSKKDQYEFLHGRQEMMLLDRFVVTGATMAFRSELVGLVIPFPTGYVHDAWIATCLSLIGYPGVLLDKSLVKYRQHTAQQIGAEYRAKLPTKNDRINAYKMANFTKEKSIRLNQLLSSIDALTRMKTVIDLHITGKGFRKMLYKKRIDSRIITYLIVIEDICYDGVVKHFRLILKNLRLLAVNLVCAVLQSIEFVSRIR